MSINKEDSKDKNEVTVLNPVQKIVSLLADVGIVFQKRFIYVWSRYGMFNHENTNDIKYLIYNWRNTEEEYPLAIIDLKLKKFSRLQDYPAEKESVKENVIKYLMGLGQAN